MRPQVSVFMATSLDGFIAREDGGLDWLDTVAAEGEDYGYAAFFATIDTLVVGRATWEVVRGFEPWPWAGKRVVVLTRKGIEASHGEQTHAGPLAPLLDSLGGGRVYLDGGVTITGALAEGLVDDVTISILPRLIGSGIRLFGEGVPERAWTLAESRAYPSGLVQLRYTRA